MKVLRTIHAVILSSLFLSLSAYADLTLVTPDTSSPESNLPEFLLEAPEMPSNVAIQNLPRTMKSERKQSTNCYAAYLIQKDGHRSHRERDEIVYEVDVTNLGDCVLRDTWVVDYLPRHTRLVRAFPEPRFEDHDHDVIHWKREWLVPGDTARFFIRVRVREDMRPDWITNTACAWNSLIGQKICAWASVWWEGSAPSNS